MRSGTFTRRLKVALFSSIFFSVVSAPAFAGQNGVPEPLRIAMTASIVSSNGEGVYERITQYLSKKTGLRIELVTGLAYDTVNEMIKAQEVQLAFVCALPYLIARESGASVEPMVAPVMTASRYQDRPIYFSDLVVRADSPYRKFSDLRGKALVYNEVTSNSGYNLPRHHMIKLGETQGFFGKVFRSGSHEESMHLVAEGKADASFIDSLVLDFARAKGVGFAKKLRVIESLGPSASPPLVVSSQLPKALREKIKQVLASMHQEPEGRAILDQALVAHFTPITEAHFDEVRAKYETAKKAKFLRIK